MILIGGLSESDLEIQVYVKSSVLFYRIITIEFCTIINVERLHLIFLLQFLQAHTSHVEIQRDEGLDVAVELGLCEQVGGVGAVALFLVAVGTDDVEIT